MGKFLDYYIRGKGVTRGQAQPHFPEKSGAGQAALSLVFLVGGTVVLIGTTLTFLVISFINTTFGYQAANRALGVALAGANDALWKLSKDRSYAVVAATCDYNLPVGSDQAHVVTARKDGVCGGASKPTNPNEAWINSEASYLGRIRRINMVVSIDPISGRVEITSMAQSVIIVSGGGET